MNLKTVGLLGVKELRGLLRDPIMLVLILYAFSLSIWTSANATPEALNNAAISIVDEDQSHLSSRVTASFYAPHFVPPQMINTMMRQATPAGSGSLTEAFYADPIRRYMLPVLSDRLEEWGSHPYASRDSLHEQAMWVAEGLTHRYPTKVLAELLPTDATDVTDAGDPAAEADRTDAADPGDPGDPGSSQPADA